MSLAKGETDCRASIRGTLGSVKTFTGLGVMIEVRLEGTRLSLSLPEEAVRGLVLLPLGLNCNRAWRLASLGSRSKVKDRNPSTNLTTAIATAFPHWDWPSLSFW